jgi:hypothetical protein
MSIQIENTDTFGGEANYCWVSRWYCTDVLTDAQAIRLAKRLAGYTGLPCKKEGVGDTVTLRPRGMCQVLFVDYCEAGHEQGKRVDRHGNVLAV